MGICKWTRAEFPTMPRPSFRVLLHMFFIHLLGRFMPRLITSPPESGVFMRD